MLVRAVELADRTGILLPHGVRERCTREAGPPEAGAAAHGDAHLLPDEEAFLARRAALAEAELRRRSPELAAVAEEHGMRGWPRLAVAVLAFCAGFMSHPAAADRHLNLLAFPLLGLIAWNLAIYLLLLVHALRPRSGKPETGPLVAWITHGLARLRVPRTASVAEEPGQAGVTAVATAASRFIRDWTGRQAPLLIAETRTLLHAAALLLALGMAASIVFRGFYLEYRAGWESTFLGAEAVHAILRFVLAPAALLIRIPVPDAVTIGGLRFGPGFDGENAAPWIWLYLAATGLYVVAPRALLMSLSLLKASRLRSAFYFPAADDRYFHRLLQSGRGTGEVAAILWHGIDASPERRARVRDLLRDELGGRVTLEFLDPVEYGDEASIADRLAPPLERERLVVVFSLATTPEDEVQGALLGQLEAVAPGEHATPLVVVDAAPLARFASDPGLRSRYDQRVRTWQRFLEAHNATCLILDAPQPSGEAP